jgi:argininosuccinate lyase
MSQNFGFIRIADRFHYGQLHHAAEENPDVPELARGKTGGLWGISWA